MGIPLEKTTERRQSKNDPRFLAQRQLLFAETRFGKSFMIQSNVGQVIARLKRLDEAVPHAVRKSAEPGYWKSRLASVALKTIRAQWASEPNPKLRQLYETLTPKVVSTLVADTFEGGTYFAMHVPEPGKRAATDFAAAASFNISQRTPTGRTKKSAFQQNFFRPDTIDKSAAENLERARQIVLDWVKIEKNLDARDRKSDGSFLSEEEIAERIGAILGIGRSGVIPRERTENVQTAAESLSSAIQRWLDGEGENPPVNYDKSEGKLSPDVAGTWLNAVLLAWQKYLIASLPARVSFHLAKVFQVQELL
jgi:hypothetical protein